MKNSQQIIEEMRQHKEEYARIRKQLFEIKDDPESSRAEQLEAIRLIIEIDREGETR